MSIFSSQFSRAHPYRDAYAGDARDSRWRTPAGLAGGVGVAGAVAAGAVVAAAAATPAGEQLAGDPPEVGGETWGEGWDSGWDTGTAGAADAGTGDADAGAWMDRGDYTDAGVGGDDDFFYFVDGDSSLAIG